MGDFIVYRQNKIDKAAHNAMLETLSAQGSKNPTILQDDSYSIILYDKTIAPIANFTHHNNGDFCGSSGSFFYKGQNGKAALDLFLADFNPDHYSPYGFMGVFTLIVKKQTRLFIISDPMGASRIFHNHNQTIWSSSFLALAENVPSLSLNKHALYEYCFQETNYGADTIFNEISAADSLCYFQLNENSTTAHLKNIIMDFNPSDAPYEDQVSEHSHLLQNQMQSLVSSYGQKESPKIATALSGGYDSRLLLALAQNAGAATNVYVYGSEVSPDVKIAKTIASAEGFSLNHVDKAKHPKPSPLEYPSIVKDNFYSLDGYPNEGIFDFGANMATRRERAQNSTLLLNGGGGEIYRNFFYMPEGKYSISDLLNIFYSRYAKDYCTDKFIENDYREILRHKIKTALNLDNDLLNRSQLEYAYPAFRLRYWTSKDNSNSTRLGSYLTPFICYETIQGALKIPLKYKNHGKFQGDVINKVSPRLASYPSDYGYRFNQEVPFKVKLKNYLTFYRPPILRRYSYALQQKFATLQLPAPLSQDYLSTVLPDGTPYMNDYFKMDKIKDAALLGRILTLEYLFKHLKL